MGPKILIATLFLVILGGAGIVLGEAPRGDSNHHAVREQICGVVLLDDSLEVDVVSSGCTDVDDFCWVIEWAEPSEATAQMIRIVPDNCDSVEHTVTLVFDRTDLGLNEIGTLNIQNLLRSVCPLQR